MTPILTQDDLATILAEYDCTPIFREQQICTKAGVCIALCAYARRVNSKPLLIDAWAVLMRKSEEQVRDMVERKLQEVAL